MKLLLIALTAAALAAPLAQAAPKQNATHGTARSAQAAQVIRARHTIRNLTVRTWRYQDARHAKRWPSRHVERNVHHPAKLHRLTQLWYHRLVHERKAYLRWQRTVPVVGDWLTAVRVVQRWFPGSQWWLESCSASEGAHGDWIPNHSGSGAGGWMQYMEGTFWHDYNRAVGYLQALGVIVPRSTASWYSPTGQALAAGWAYGHDRPPGKWVGGGC